MVDSLIIHNTLIASTTYLHQKARSPRQITGVDIMCVHIGGAWPETDARSINKS